MKHKIFSLIVILFVLAQGFLPAAAALPLAGQGAQDQSTSAADKGQVLAAEPQTESLEPNLGFEDLSFQVQNTAISTSADSDWDGLTDEVEANGWWNAEGFFVTDPYKLDSDSDGLSDGKEKLYETDPLDAHSPGIYVEYEDHLKTRQYTARKENADYYFSYWFEGELQVIQRDYPYPWGWQEYGESLISFDAVVVRRGSSFSVGGPISATAYLTKSLSALTDLKIEQDPCAGRWRVSVPKSGTVGIYGLTLQDGAWSKSLNLYVIFELPATTAKLSQDMIDVFLYDDDPDDLRDETSVLIDSRSDVYEYKYYDVPESIPEGAWVNAGNLYRYQNQQFEPFVFETHVIKAINGQTNPYDAAFKLVDRVDQVTRFYNPWPLTDSWKVLHRGYVDKQQCSQVSALLTTFARSAGIPARSVFTDWVHATFDHATEIWANDQWYTARGYDHFEYYDFEPNNALYDATPVVLPEHMRCDWDCDFTPQSHNYPTTRYNWGRDRYRPWHSDIPVEHSGNGSVILAVGTNWPYWLGSSVEYRWPSWDWDAITKKSWVETLFAPYWERYGWTREPVVQGDAYSWPSKSPDFGVSALQATRTAPQGGSTSYTVRVTGSNFSNHVDFINISRSWDRQNSAYSYAIRGLPSGATYEFSPVRCFPNCDVTLTINIADTTPTGTYELTIRGYSGGLERKTKVGLVVTPPASFVVTALPESREVVQGGSTNYQIDVDALYGFDSPVTLSVTGVPDGTTIRFPNGNTTTSCTPDCESTLTVMPTTDTPAGTYVLTVHGNSGSIHRQDTVGLIVTESGGAAGMLTHSLLASGGEMAAQDLLGLDARGVNDYGLDVDGDGYLDRLVVEVEVETAQAGSYWLEGQLGVAPGVSAPLGSGGLIDSQLRRVDLVEGTNLVRFFFDGLMISAAQVDGPYVLARLSITVADQPSPEDFLNPLGYWLSLYTTSAYQADEFQNWGAVLTGEFTEQGSDVDGDALYESLDLTAQLKVFKPGNYTVQGELFDAQGNFVARATWTGEGTLAKLGFDDIEGTSGPYRLESVVLLDPAGNEIDSIGEAYTTQTVLAAEHGTGIIEAAEAGIWRIQGLLTDGYSDYGWDDPDDADALYDALVIDVPVAIEAAGEYRLEGWLARDDLPISWSSSALHSFAVTGTYHISLTFSGLAISAFSTDGPYELAMLKLVQGTGYTVVDQLALAHTTATYTIEQFESLPYLKPEADQRIFFQDHMESGVDKWEASSWALTDNQYHTPTHSWNGAGGNISVATVSKPLTETIHPVLRFQTCYALQTGVDYGHVEMSTNGGVNWSTVVTFTGSTTLWGEEMWDLGIVDGGSDLRVRFRLAAKGSTRLGWYVDDVIVYFDSDLDDDGIPNDVEIGSDPSSPVDTDGDGNPDYLDEDSDDDGIPDAVESGPDPKHPVDTDGDGMPDYQDEDSDDDGIPDAVEVGPDPHKPADTDGDGIPDYRDEDSDNDDIPDAVEVGPDPNKPVDTDGDGIPDYRDEDSDDDDIPDEVEVGPDPNKPVDTDGDGIPDYLDEDSDDDGIPDAVEAGPDPNKPVDTDWDRIPDYLDEDSDNDHIPDSEDPEPYKPVFFIFMPAVMKRK